MYLKYSINFNIHIFFLKLGLDLQMVGFVIAEKKYSLKLNILRRNIRTFMYQIGVAKFPSYRNAEILYACLDSLNHDKKRVLLTFPKNWRELGWSHGGGILTVTFEEKRVNNRPCLDFLISFILEKSKKDNVPFTK